MNENLNLVEILKDCPKNTKLYSTALGEIKFDHIEDNDTYPIIVKNDYHLTESFTIDGKMYDYGEECILFPSKEQRDWSKFNHNKMEDKL